MHPSIYVSSSCLKNRKIRDSVQQLATEGFTNIELSGGTDHYPEMLPDLLELQSRFGLRFRCHNYFPPPSEHFVLNLSVANDFQARKAKQHVLEAVNISKILGATRYGIHAGFRMQPKLNELGRPIQKKEMVSVYDAIQSFSGNWHEINKELANYNVSIYIENNVFSQANYESFGGVNPFLATDYKSIKELLFAVGGHLLLDVAHLKVSCKTLGLDFEQELSLLVSESDYLHISDNDGSADTNEGLKLDSELYQLLEQQDVSQKTFTLEVYDGVDSVWESYDALVKLLELQGAA